MSLYTVGSIGIGPLGSLAAGALADILGGTFSGLVLGLEQFPGLMDEI